MATSEPTRSSPEPAKKTTAKKTAPTKRAARNTADKAAPREASPSRQRVSASQVASRAAQQLLDLTAREVEGVTGLSRTEEGWIVQVEVLESKRIPDTTDVLALYEIELDGEAELLGYHRVRRYVRGKPSEG